MTDTTATAVRARRLSDAEYEKLYPVADALREAGFIPIPQYWIKSDDMAKLKALTNPHRDEVNRIRQDVQQQLGMPEPTDSDYGAFPIGLASDVTDDPRFNKDAAWEAFKRTTK